MASITTGRDNASKEKDDNVVGNLLPDEFPVDHVTSEVAMKQLSALSKEHLHAVLESWRAIGIDELFGSLISHPGLRAACLGGARPPPSMWFSRRQVEATGLSIEQIRAALAPTAALYGGYGLQVRLSNSAPPAPAHLPT